MKISKKTDKLTGELISFSGSKIKFEDDLKMLIELSGTNEKLFDDIMFTAKYLNGLGKILKTNIAASANPEGNGKSVSAEETRAKIMDEFKLNMKKLSDMMVEYLKNVDEETRNAFADKFLALNRESLQNLTSLIYDLSWLKIFLNTKR